VLVEAAEKLVGSVDSDATVVVEEIKQPEGAVGGAELGAMGGSVTPSGKSINAEVMSAAATTSQATSDSSDVSFHSVGDVTTVPSDLEVSETDEETAVFEPEKGELKGPDETVKTTKLWSEAVAESAVKSGGSIENRI
jgi:hypothetical protein